MSFKFSASPSFPLGAHCRAARLRAAALSLLILSGCSLTGLHADEDFACPMDAGTPCESTAVAYQKSVSGQYALEDEVRRQEAARERAEADKGLLTRLKESLTSARPMPAADDELTTSRGTDIPDAEKAGRPDSPTNPADAASREPAARPWRQPDPAADSKMPTTYDPAIVVTSLTARPERLPEAIVTIWIAPWTDADGDFHEGEKIHARVFDARWAAARRRAEEARGGRAVVTLPFANDALLTRSRIAHPRTGKVDRRADASGLSADQPSVEGVFGQGAAMMNATTQGMTDDAGGLARQRP